MEKTIEIYGKEIKKDNNKFISCSCKVEKDGKVEFINVRLTRECGYNAVKGLQKISFDLADSNVKVSKGDDGKEYKTLYISKCVNVPYTDEEKQAMADKQAKKVADLFE